MFPTEPVPEKIGAYRVIRRVASSGNADVYVARLDGPMGFQRTVALKLVRFSIDEDARLAEELEREASICARLNHPSVLRMFDFFQHDRRLVLVVDHVEGATLDRLLHHLNRRKQKLADKAIFFIGLQLASALSHAHATVDEDGTETPVIHRNLHPENVLISWEGQVSLTGFGLGKILGRSPDTIAGTIKGKEGFMAPEQTRGERVTTRADVYGLGILLWSLLTGRRPPKDGHPPTPLSELRPDLPRELQAALKAALEPNPDRRKITCQDLELWLSKIVKPVPARKELREKALLLRATRTPVGDSPEGAKPGRGKHRRRLTLRNVKASQKPADPGPLSQPSPPSSRPELRDSTAAPTTEDSVTAILDNLAMPPPPMFSAAPEDPSMSTESSVVTVFPAPPASTRSTGPMSASPLSRASRRVSGPAQQVGEENMHALHPPSMGAVSRAGPTSMPAESMPAGLPPLPPAGAADPRSPRSSRSLSILESVGVASLTALLVVLVGSLVMDRDDDRRAAAPAPVPTPTPTKAPAPAPPAPEVTAVASATPPPPPPPAPPKPNGTQLPGGKGYLTVKTEVGADVYLNGKKVGPANEALVVDCGRWFLRLGTSVPGGFPAWVGPGSTVLIGCQTDTELHVSPSPSNNR